MRLYNDLILPQLIHWSMRQDILAAYRRRIVTAAAGRVLELGIGSGLNLPFYDAARVTNVLGLDSSFRLLSMSRRPALDTPHVTALVAGSAEAIPLADASVDTVVTTWTLCSIADAARALGEARRVLEPDGRLLFVEHGRAPDASVVRWQDRVTPVWKRIAGGCHLNRPISQLIEASGFRIEQLDTGYMDGPRFMTFMYEGCARPR